jgi:hypothetical protein
MTTEKWIRDGQRVLYHAMYPPRNETDTYEGTIDGSPWTIGTSKRLVVRLKDMDARYKIEFGRTVVPFTDIDHISRKEDDHE